MPSIPSPTVRRTTAPNFRGKAGFKGEEEDTVDGNQKSGINSPVEGKVVEIPFFTNFQKHPRWLFGISEPSTVPHLLIRKYVDLYNDIDSSTLNSGWSHTREAVICFLSRKIHEAKRPTSPNDCCETTRQTKSEVSPPVAVRVHPC